MPFVQIETENPALPEKLERRLPPRHGHNGTVRLSPIPARNTLLTILFFSAVAVAIGYWIFFPPVASPPSEKPAASFPTPAPTALSKGITAANHP